MATSPQLSAVRVALPTALAAVALAACGSKAPTTSATHRTPAKLAGDMLCANQGALVGLQVSERSLQNGNQEPSSQSPGPVSVPSVAEARAIARTVCELPPIPGAQQRCHSSPQGTVLLLTFRTKLGYLPAVMVETSACFTVTGAGPVRSARATALSQDLHAIVHHEPPVVIAN